MRLGIQLDSFHKIEPESIRRLKLAGFYSIENLAFGSPVDIAKLLDINIDEAVSICNKATIELEERGIISRSSLMERNDRSNHNRLYIKTGSQELDQLFGTKRNRNKSDYSNLRSVCHRKNPALSYLVCDCSTTPN